MRILGVRFTGPAATAVFLYFAVTIGLVLSFVGVDVLKPFRAKEEVYSPPPKYAALIQKVPQFFGDLKLLDAFDFHIFRYDPSFEDLGTLRYHYPYWYIIR